jgi:hypothetical protein
LSAIRSESARRSKPALDAHARPTAVQNGVVHDVADGLFEQQPSAFTARRRPEVGGPP